MEKSISSSRTAGASFSYGHVRCCYASVDGPHAVAEASEDSGWTAYFYDDEDGDSYLQLQASEEEPAPALPAPRKKKAHRHGHEHGDRASASTVSTASKAKARKKKEVPKEEKKRPRWEPADEDPLQDTASSMPANATPQLQLKLQDGWQIAACYDQQRSSDTALQWIDCRSLQETHMGLPGEARCRKEGIASCLISPS